jgi:hypothetical protein
LTRDDRTALDLLEEEDRQLRQILADLRAERDGSVEARARYGDLSKELIRHVTTREAALVDVAAALSGVAGMGDVSERLQRNGDVRRPQIAEIEHMSRGIQGINLNKGQDFDGALTALATTLESEIDWDLSGGIARMASAIEGSEHEEQLRSAKSVKQHAPTNLHPDGPRWYERAPVISRVITLYDRLRDFPKAAQSR